MNENETIVVEQSIEGQDAETVEQTAAQPVEQPAEEPKLYTESEFNAKLDEVLGKKIARKEAKIKKEYDRKYSALENILKAGTGAENLDEMTNTLKTFYEQKGIKIPEMANYSQKDIEVLAKAEAEEIIRSGFDEVVEEVDRLSAVGAKNMTAREKALFKALAEHRQRTERNQELSRIGVAEDVYNSEEFKNFAGKFNSNTPIADIYDIYSKTQPKKPEVRTMGSMKNNTSEDGTVKDFYTRDEALQFTKKDFDKNPALFKAVEASMLKW